MPRTVLVHLNALVPDDDDREPDQLAQEIVDMLAMDPDLARCEISAPLAEEA